MNDKFDNAFSNTIVVMVGTLVRTMERAIVVFWDGLRNATVHGTPSLLGFVAAIAPVLAPIPIASQTANSLMVFMNWAPFQAIIMAIVIESAGFVLWVFLTESIMNDGWKGTTTQYVFGVAVAVYQVVLILINVGLAVNDGTRGTVAWVLLLASLFPALCSIAYGYNNIHSKEILEQERIKTEAENEKIRQERRADRKEAAALKIQYAKDGPRAELEQTNGANFRKVKP